MLQSVQRFAIGLARRPRFDLIDWLRALLACAPGRSLGALLLFFRAQARLTSLAFLSKSTLFQRRGRLLGTHFFEID